MCCPAIGLTAVTVEGGVTWWTKCFSFISKMRGLKLNGSFVVTGLARRAVGGFESIGPWLAAVSRIILIFVSRFFVSEAVLDTGFPFPCVVPPAMVVLAIDTAPPVDLRTLDPRWNGL